MVMTIDQTSSIFCPNLSPMSANKEKPIMELE